MAWAEPIVDQDRLPWVTLFARLEEAGYKAWEIPRLRRWWIKRVTFHPRDDKGDLKRSGARRKKHQPISWEQMVRRELLRRQWPMDLIEDHLAQARVRRAEEVARQSSRGNKPRPGSSANKR